MRHYRAMISVPITAESDEAAEEATAWFADLFRSRGGPVLGHVELVTEVTWGGMWPVRVIAELPGFRAQIPMMVL